MKPPATPAIPVSEVHHGEHVDDPYRWLEDGESPEVREWTAAQNRATEAWLAAVPFRARIRERLAALLAIGGLGVPRPARGRYVYLRRDGAQNQPVLYVRDGRGGPDRVAVDPNALNPDGTTALDWYHVSDDGRLLAYGLSENGTERSVLHVLDLDTLEHHPDRIHDTRACSLAWLPDLSGFYYTRYLAPGTVPPGDEQYHRTVRFHELGTDPDGDPVVFTPERKEYWPGVALSPDGRWLLVTVARTFEQSDLYLQDRVGGGDFVPVAEGLPALFEGEVAHHRLFVRTDLDAPRYRVLAVDPERPQREHWREIVPEGGAVLERLAVTADGLALGYLERAASRLVLTDHDGGARRELPLPTLGSLFGVGAEAEGAELYYGFSSYAFPPAVYRVDLRTGEQTLWQRVEADVEPERFTVSQVEVPSRDGTRIPMFLVRRRDLAPNGDRPVYLTGYGGFNVSMTPAFSRSLLLWLESGGVVAVPNLRGGGEFGEAWHRDGMLDRKQNTFDDFIAAAEWLIREGWTRPERLAAAGGSNGGLLMGAVLTQRPDLFRAVVVQVPLLDMLRYHRFLIARLWIPEYGSAEDPMQYRWLRAYSPYHHVTPGAAYPAVLLATAESDTRVDPMHARKMAARLQAATASGHPVLLRLEPRAGHGAGKPLNKVLDELTDTWSFVFHELGVEPDGPRGPA